MSHYPTNERAAAPDPEATVMRFSIGFVEPLLSTVTRVQLDADLLAVFQYHTQWSRIWAAGVLADQVLTLPDDDPWRQLAGRINRRGDDDLVIGVEAPRVTGATLGGRPFGTLRNATDLIEPVFADLRIDSGLAAIAEPLRPESGAMIAFAARGWRRAIEAADAICLGLADAPPHTPATRSAASRALSNQMGGAWFEVSAEATRWVLHRRRCYGLTDDPWPVESAWKWAQRASRVVAGKAFATGEIEEAIARERIVALT